MFISGPFIPLYEARLPCSPSCSMAYVRRHDSDSSAYMTICETWLTRAHRIPLSWSNSRNRSLRGTYAVVLYNLYVTVTEGVGAIMMIVSHPHDAHNELDLYAYHLPWYSETDNRYDSDVKGAVRIPTSISI